MKIYNYKEIEKLTDVIKKAKALWEDLVTHNAKTITDGGSCVSGIGIEIFYIPRKCRTPRFHMIIEAPAFSHQGAGVYLTGIELVLNYLKENGIDACLNYGYMS